MTPKAPKRHRFRPLGSILPAFLLASMIFAGACDFQVLEPWDPPRWGISLTLPLINQKYNLSELVENDTTIRRDTTTHELQIEFAGTLDTTKIDSSFLEVTLPAEASRIDINQSSPGVDASFFSGISKEVQIILELDSLLRNIHPILFDTVDFPAGYDFTILQSVWNDFVAGEALENDEAFVLFNEDSLVQANEFIKAIRYTQLSATEVSEFTTRVTTPDFPTNVDSILIAATSGFYFDIKHDTTTLPPDGDFYRNSNMQSDSLGSDIELALRVKLPTAASDVEILAGEDPRIEFTIGVTVGGLDSLAITTAETSLLDEPPDPLPLPSNIQINEGRLRSNVLPPINQISIDNLGTSLPFDIRFQLVFPNFDSLGLGEKSLTMGPYILSDGNPLVSEEKSVADYVFKDPDGEGPISEFEYELGVDILEKDVVLPLDGDTLGVFNVSLGVGVDLDDPSDLAGDLYFESIDGNFGISFDAVNTTIEDIPTGFTGFEFGRLSLSLLLRNQIDLPVVLDLELTGTSIEGNTASVPINPRLNYPSAEDAPPENGDTTYTLIVMDENSVRTYWLTENGTDVSAAWDSSVSQGSNGETILEVLNLPPETIEVSGSAVVEGEGVVQAGKGIWGTFQLIAPFALVLDQDISFLPTAPIPWGPTEADTRQQIQTALLSASLTSSVRTKFPLGGKLSMLASDTTLFTLALDYLDDIAAGIPTAARTGDTTVYTTLQGVLEADSIMDVERIVFYPESPLAGQTLDPQQTVAKRVEFYTNQGDTFWVGHLFDMELPGPTNVNDLGWVLPGGGGDTSQVIELDADRVEWITSSKPMYLKTFITLYATDGVRTIQSNNWIHFAAFMTFDLRSDIFEVPAPIDSSTISVKELGDVTLYPDSTTTLDLDSLFVLPEGMTYADVEVSTSSSHSGIAKAVIRTVRITGEVRKVLQVQGKGPGTARITVYADDDPEDETAPASASFLVNVVEEEVASTPTYPFDEVPADHNSIQWEKASRRYK